MLLSKIIGTNYKSNQFINKIILFQKCINVKQSPDEFGVLTDYFALVAENVEHIGEYQ